MMDRIWAVGSGQWADGWLEQFDASAKCGVRNRPSRRLNLGYMKHFTKAQRIISWSARLIAAGILLQTLFFKFSGAPESVYIFTKVGMEPWGRYGSGVAERVAALLLLRSSTAWLGAGLALGVMSGAIASHLTVLGIVVKDDGGLLFGLALAVAVCSNAILILHRAEIPFLGAWLAPVPARVQPPRRS